MPSTPYGHDGAVHRGRRCSSGWWPSWSQPRRSHPRPIGAGRAAPEPSAADKIKPQLAQQLEQKDEASLLGPLRAGRPLGRRQVEDWTERGQAVYDALTAAADASQQEARRCSTRPARRTRPSGPRTRSGSTPATRRWSTSSPACAEVQSLWPTREYERRGAHQGQGPQGRSTRSSGASPTSTPTTSGTSSASRARASSVANIDTGVQFDHPALVEPVPRQQRRRHVRPQLQLVRRRRHLRRRAVRHQRPRHRTRWARWSATTAAPTRSASLPARSGSPPTAAAPPTRR